MPAWSENHMPTPCAAKACHSSVQPAPLRGPGRAPKRVRRLADQRTVFLPCVDVAPAQEEIRAQRAHQRQAHHQQRHPRQLLGPRPLVRPLLLPPGLAPAGLPPGRLGLAPKPAVLAFAGACPMTGWPAAAFTPAGVEFVALAGQPLFVAAWPALVALPAVCGVVFCCGCFHGSLSAHGSPQRLAACCVSCWLGRRGCTGTRPASLLVVPGALPGRDASPARPIVACVRRRAGSPCVPPVVGRGAWWPPVAAATDRPTRCGSARGSRRWTARGSSARPFRLAAMRRLGLLLAAVAIGGFNSGGAATFVPMLVHPVAVRVMAMPGDAVLSITAPRVAAESAGQPRRSGGRRCRRGPRRRRHATCARCCRTDCQSAPANFPPGEFDCRSRQASARSRCASRFPPIASAARTSSTVGWPNCWVAFCVSLIT